ncbi:survival protein sure-like phosphatase/nucleotidase [Halteromyces radiatus]|uniref:survival protein sure-like phosphatase/nucleotidase n=1 Tax=Halteromyces radiatus TaxID=101107 RepID=UPI00222014D8|nr:survival protein sure-like phosphatase/nucleotidase [Halteromyces radiatus]KAI8097706.1 survival protein sure-like phosphatase/nucleotidase [Halteromyces radiatus]
MTKPLNVLICNDDGPPNTEESPFVLPFVEHLEQLGWNVKVCVPNSQKSWISKSFMIMDHIELSYFHRKTHEISYHQQDPSDFILLSGTPATCINIALHHLFKDEHFDLVVCGPNFVYTLASGTIGCAMEATLCNQKAIALSFPFYSRDFSPNCIQNACTMATEVIQQLYEKNKWPVGGLFNINVPLVEDRCPIHMTKFHQGSYGSLFKPLKNNNNDNRSSYTIEEQVRLESESGGGRTIFKFSPDFKALVNAKEPVPGTDAWSVAQRCISVTPMIAAFEMANLDIDYGVGLNKL